MVGDRAVTRNDYLTQPQLLILVTGSFILAVAFESVLCYYICKWNAFKQRRRVSERQLDGMPSDNEFSARSAPELAQVRTAPAACWFRTMSKLTLFLTSLAGHVASCARAQCTAQGSQDCCCRCRCHARQRRRGRDGQVV